MQLCVNALQSMVLRLCYRVWRFVREVEGAFESEETQVQQAESSESTDALRTHFVQRFRDWCERRVDQMSVSSVASANETSPYALMGRLK